MSKTYIIDALRLHLKARNITYKELADAIEPSEISVKRQQFCGRNLKGVGQFTNVDQRDIALTALYTTEIAASNTCF